MNKSIKYCLTLNYHKLINDLYRHKRVSTQYIRLLSTSQQSKQTNNFNKVLTIPNILCLARIAITPIVGILVIKHQYPYALILCSISALTDLLDGYIARRYNSVTKLGSILDPLADKLLVATLTITLTIVNLIPVWLTLLIILRDTLIISGAAYLRYKTLIAPKTFSRYFRLTTYMESKFVPTLISKINTGFQFSLVALTLAAPVFGYTDHCFLTALQMSTMCTTLVSGLDYLKRLKQ